MNITLQSRFTLFAELRLFANLCTLVPKMVTFATTSLLEIYILVVSVILGGRAIVEGGTRLFTAFDRGGRPAQKMILDFLSGTQ